MKKFILALLALCMADLALADDATWLTSVPQAAAQASQENKILLLDFTGSDWCGWCKKLEADTFSKPEFQDYAAKNLVLVTVDFPAHKQLPTELKDANQALKAKYGINGYPTIIALKPDGTVLWKQTGYLRGGPQAMIAKLNEVIPNARPATPSTPAPSPAKVAAAPPIIYPAPPARQPGDAPKLSGILYSSTHATAVLNGRTCEVGDTIEGALVLKIARDKVTVEWNGTTRELRLN